MMKNKFFIFLFSISIQISFSQVSKRVYELSKKLDTISYAESSHVGFAGTPSSIYSDYRKIDSVATNDELFHFAKNGSNSLKFYALTSLVTRKDIPKITWLYKLYSMYPIEVSYQSGCEVQTISLTEVIKNKLEVIENIIRDDRQKIIDKQILHYKKQLEENNLTAKKKIYIEGFIKDLNEEKLFLKQNLRWSREELSEIIENLKIIDKTIKR